MSQVFTGVSIIVNGNNDVAVFAELLSSIDYDTLKEANKGRPLSVTRDQFDLFIARQGHNLIGAGILDEELTPTGRYTLEIQ